MDARQAQLPTSRIYYTMYTSAWDAWAWYNGSAIHTQAHTQARKHTHTQTHMYVQTRKARLHHYISSTKIWHTYTHIYIYIYTRYLGVRCLSLTGLSSTLRRTPPSTNSDTRMTSAGDTDAPYAFRARGGTGGEENVSTFYKYHGSETTSATHVNEKLYVRTRFPSYPYVYIQGSHMTKKKKKKTRHCCLCLRQKECSTLHTVPPHPFELSLPTAGWWNRCVKKKKNT